MPAPLHTPPFKTGLSSKDITRLTLQYGPNEIEIRKNHTLLSFLVTSFKNPLGIILLVAAALSAYFGETLSSAIIILIVLASSIFDAVNSYKSDKAAQELKKRVRITVTVIRDAEQSNIPVSALVPGDIVILSAGDIVPADGNVVAATHLFSNESSLTGEAYPQAKNVGSELYMGSSISSGEGIMQVTKTGAATQFSKVVVALNTKVGLTEFDREIRDFSFLILRVALILVIVVFAVNTILKGSALTSLLFAIALAVGITPELLPMIITLNLTKGSLAMAKHGVIVKKLSSLQNFGSMNVLCTDKTGTLTEDHISLVKYVDGAGKTCDATLLYAYLNSVLTTGFKNPLDDAIRDFRHLDSKSYKKIDELPFDFERRRESVVVEHAGKILLIAKGSPEGVMRVCSEFDDAATRAVAKKTYQQLSRDGFRVLAIASRVVKRKASYETTEEKDMSFQGFVAFLDPAKLTAAPTLAEMQRLGIAIKIITGDNELVTQRIAQDISLPVTGVVTGDQLDTLSPQQLEKAVREISIFARVNPEQKLRIIQTLQKAGNVVGYMGDGINDAPSLRAADVGISVNNATDIAKDSADLILLHKSLQDLVGGVREGRKTFVNTLKYLRMVLASNYGNVFSMAGASVILPFLPMLPTQVLLNNLLYEASQFALPSDNVDEEEILKPRRLHIQEIKRFMLVFGPISSVFDFMTFGVLYWGFNLLNGSFQTGWFLESLATQTLVVYIIRTKKIPFLQSSPSLTLLIGASAAVGVSWLITVLPIGSLLGFTPLPFPALLTIASIVALYLGVVEIAKHRFFASESTIIR